MKSAWFEVFLGVGNKLRVKDWPLFQHPDAMDAMDTIDAHAFRAEVVMRLISRFSIHISASLKQRPQHTKHQEIYSMLSGLQILWLFSNTSME